MTDVERLAAIAAVMVGLLALGALAAAVPGPVPHPDAEAARKVRDGACRWEVSDGVPWLDAPSVGPAPEALRPVTLLLDQCSGRTWTLSFARGVFEWRPVRREPDWAVVLEGP